MTPHFRVRWNFHFENEKPRRKIFSIPENGICRLPMEFIGTESGLNTVSLDVEPHSKYEAGHVIELDCETISYEHLHQYITVGSSVRLWNGDFFANGTIVAVYPRKELV